MKLIEKYKEFLNNPEIVSYIGESKRRKFLVKGITALAITFLLIAAVILGLVLGNVLFSYFG
jgi:hypothetical protein